MIVTTYDRRFQYILEQDNRLRPLIPIRITYRGQSTDRLALVDSGADLPTFPKAAARLLGIDLSTLVPSQLRGISEQPVRTWACQCDITVEGITKQCTVGIVDNDNCKYLLGRDPFFKLLQIGFRESRGEFYLSLSP